MMPGGWGQPAGFSSSCSSFATAEPVTAAATTIVVVVFAVTVIISATVAVKVKRNAVPGKAGYQLRFYRLQRRELPVTKHDVAPPLFPRLHLDVAYRSTD